AERSTPDRGVQPRPLVVEMERRDDGVERPDELRTFDEERQTRGVVRDGARVLRHRDLARERAAEPAGAPFEEGEAGGGRLASADQAACDRPEQRYLADGGRMAHRRSLPGATCVAESISRESAGKQRGDLTEREPSDSIDAAGEVT